MRIYARDATYAKNSVHLMYTKNRKLPNKKGIHVPCAKNMDKCTKCGLCILMCPDQAIAVDDKDEE